MLGLRERFMINRYNLSRFISAHEKDFLTALAEIKSGRKQTHWMWYIFPQIKGLGNSYTSRYYSIKNEEEAKCFLNEPYLSAHLYEICHALLALDSSDATEIMGKPDDKKLRSSMTLFASVSEDNNIFLKVLEKFFNGKQDVRTLKILNENKEDLL